MKEEAKAKVKVMVKSELGPDDYLVPNVNLTGVACSPKAPADRIILRTCDRPQLEKYQGVMDFILDTTIMDYELLDIIFFNKVNKTLVDKEPILEFYRGEVQTEQIGCRDFTKEDMHREV